MSKVKPAEAPLLIYTGPEQSFDLRVADGDGTKLVPLACIPGQPLDIPADHPIALSLTAADFLVAAPAAAAPALTE